MTHAIKWSPAAESALTAESLTALLRNEIPAVRIRNFATSAECSQMADAMRSGKKKEYGVDRSIGYIGIAQYAYRWGRTKKDYFDAVPQAFADQKFVFDRSFDAVARFITVLAAVWPEPVGFAEDEYGRYFAGIIRFASQGIGLHADFAPYNMPGYAVEAITAQLAWNLFVETPEKGGVTTIFNAPWSAIVESGTPPSSYGFSPEMVAGRESFSYAPSVGDVVLFNSRNPHDVSAGESLSGSGRLQVGSFVGQMPDRSLVLFA